VQQTASNNKEMNAENSGFFIFLPTLALGARQCRGIKASKGWKFFLDGCENVSCILLTLDAEINHKVKREKGEPGFAGGGGEFGEPPPTPRVVRFSGCPENHPGSNFIDRPGEA
jgi:hypothetical protein